VPTLVVQMGHVPRTTGSTGTAGGGTTEQDYARSVAARCVEHLHGRGGWSVKTINADVADAEYRGDGFVAVHCDGGSPDAHGAAVGHQTSEGDAVGEVFKAAYARRGWTSGFKADNYTTNLGQYYGVREAVGQGNRRAIIVECGFLTSAIDQSLLLSEDGPTRVALSIGDAFGIPLDPATTPTTRRDDDTVYGTITPTAGHMSGKLSIPVCGAVGKVNSTVEGARLWFSTGWWQEIKYQAWCVGEGGGYTNETGEAPLPLPFTSSAISDRPGWFYLPANTACVNIAWSAKIEDVPFSWGLERWIT
jgi:hypothetical protein